jgi:HAD superfamily hydrolase (TIGR01450 family)
MIHAPSLNTWLDRHGDGIEAVCLDIDGVLLKGRHRLPGSRRLLDLLNKKRIPFVLLTNDGNHSTREKAERLTVTGLNIVPRQIISCGHAIGLPVQSMGMKGRRFFIMGDTGVPCFAEAAGLEVTRDPEQLRSCAGVIIGEEHYDWEAVINAVVNYFIDCPQAPLIVPNPDEFYPASKLKIHIAAGGVARFIRQVLKAYGVDIAPIYLGKPFAPIFQMALQNLTRQLGRSPAPAKVMMVGDNLTADIAGGRQMGFKTALLLTGVTVAGSLEKSDILPDMVVETL